ncbi:MAG TPA: hypothetical protein VGE97_09175 [Nitrososphaera sp.]
MSEQETKVPERVRQDQERAAANKARQVRLGHVSAESKEDETKDASAKRSSSRSKPKSE